MIRKGLKKIRIILTILFIVANSFTINVNAAPGGTGQGCIERDKTTLKCIRCGSNFNLNDQCSCNSCKEGQTCRQTNVNCSGSSSSQSEPDSGEPSGSGSTSGNNASTNTVCNGIISEDLGNSLKKYFFTPVKVIAPILLLVFTTIDFAKIVFSDAKDGLPKAGQRFMKRAVATLVVFFADSIIDFILGLGGLSLCIK